LHGRTRACGFGGNAEYDTIAEVKSRVRIPVVANGDIRTPEKAQWVLTHTGADAVMIGRAAQARPWIFREIDHYLRHGTKMAPMRIADVAHLLLRHLDEHYLHYGEAVGARTARKRIHFLARSLQHGDALSVRVNQTEDCAQQRRAFEEFLQEAAARSPFFEYIEEAAGTPVTAAAHGDSRQHAHRQEPHGSSSATLRQKKAEHTFCLH
jgi:tRNA-dihydrouridine synthase B